MPGIQLTIQFKVRDDVVTGIQPVEEGAVSGGESTRHLVCPEDQGSATVVLHGVQGTGCNQVVDLADLEAIHRNLCRLAIAALDRSKRGVRNDGINRGWFYCGGETCRGILLRHMESLPGERGRTVPVQLIRIDFLRIRFHEEHSVSSSWFVDGCPAADPGQMSGQIASGAGVEYAWVSMLVDVLTFRLGCDS